MIPGAGSVKVKKARTYRGTCYKCHNPIIAGEKYTTGGASLINNVRPVHEACERMLK